ncbi:MAG: cupredoxin domain-containing protein [Acidimicrobiales bacterium]
MKLPRTLAVIFAGAAFLTACGDDDDTTTATTANGTGDVRTVEVDMVAIAFEPDSLDVEQGETVRFVFTNTGDSPHDAFIGDADAQADHEAEMREMDEGGMQGGGHGDDDAMAVQPGDTGELTYTFDQAGSFEIGCHQPGHYDAGMMIDVTVS